MKPTEYFPMKNEQDRAMLKNNLPIVWKLFSVALLSVFLAWSATPPVAWAAAANQLTLLAMQDAYTDINAATTNFDQGLLTAANSPGLPEEADVTTKQIFIEFDLSSVDFEIKNATLSLATLTCGNLVPVDVVDLVIYGVDNASGWDETTLTWATQPELSTAALVSLDAGSTTFNTAQTYTFTDDKNGAFATWLESQRGTNDGSATLVVQIQSADNPGLADIFFEDSEETGADYGCQDALGAPSLQISDMVAGFDLFLPLLSR